MIFNTEKGDIELKYTIGAFSSLKNKMKAKNLRKHLLTALNIQDYETLCKAVMEFSNGKFKNTDAVFAAIDSYAEGTEKTYYDVFLEFLLEVEEAGFFKEKMTMEQLRDAAASPGMMIDEEEIISETMKTIKGYTVASLAKRIQEEAMQTGQNTLQTSGMLSISAE